MKNITKTTKTILFASLIAVMILPFSGMNYAQAETNKTDQELIQDYVDQQMGLLDELRLQYPEFFDVHLHDKCVLFREHICNVKHKEAYDVFLDMKKFFKKMEKYEEVHSSIKFLKKIKNN